MSFDIPLFECSYAGARPNACFCCKAQRLNTPKKTPSTLRQEGFVSLAESLPLF